MKIAMTAVLAMLAAAAVAQESAAPQRRAPLASVDDLEPAVDVGAPRPAPEVAPPSTAPAAAAPTQAASRATPRVMDSLDLGTTSITGNAELPKVLYIVPWKKSDLGDLVGRPVNTLLDEVLAPVDPAVFEREAERLIDDEHVVTVFGCWTSASRRTVVPLFEARKEGPFAFLNENNFLSSDPGAGSGGVSITFYERQ